MFFCFRLEIDFYLYEGAIIRRIYSRVFVMRAIAATGSLRVPWFPAAGKVARPAARPNGTTLYFLTLLELN